ncbi:hypothetical protein QR680_011799 [Steinernema hermaphroditum]|uniref:non-specific serine/threonine protein kinase n=1 Tax=Steinernema hermaphroditum TaxID=289476 RepID=A0AA39LZM3_9BILA|nr:hypothetical protein QR680_011799 [Steinernema hermaphroditum]
MSSDEEFCADVVSHESKKKELTHGLTASESKPIYTVDTSVMRADDPQDGELRGPNPKDNEDAAPPSEEGPEPRCHHEDQYPRPVQIGVSPQDVIGPLGNDGHEQEDPNQYGPDGHYPVRIGEIFRHRYRVFKKLGFGNHARVWFCFDSEDQRFVAMKIVKSKQEYAEAALNEVKYLMRVNEETYGGGFGDRVVEMLDEFLIKGPHGKHVCIVFEALGCDLEKWKQTNYPDSAPPHDKIREIARQVLQGLDHLHQHALVHTDLHQKNVVLAVSQADIEQIATEACAKHGLMILGGAVSTAPAHIPHPPQMSSLPNPVQQIGVKSKEAQDADRPKVKIVDLGSAQNLEEDNDGNKKGSDLDEDDGDDEETVEKSGYCDEDGNDEELADECGNSDEDGSHDETVEDGDNGSRGSTDDSEDEMFDELAQHYGWSTAEVNAFKNFIEYLKDDATAKDALDHCWLDTDNSLSAVPEM